MAPPARVLGVNIASGIAYLALVEAPATPVLADPVKLEPSDAYADATRLKDFHDRFAQMVRRTSAGTVAVAYTRRHSRWVYAHAFERASLEAAIMLATASAQIDYVSVKQTKRAAEGAGIAHPDRAADELAAVLKLADVKHWKERSLALMVALAAAQRNDS
jgi:Holliday junction resolvasome RuvABC endonuclease subunit